MSDNAGAVLGYFDNVNEPQLEYLFWSGMPRDQRLALVRVTGNTLDPAAVGFTVDLVGIRITDEWKDKTGLLVSAEHNGNPLQVEVWLMRARREGVAAAYEEMFEANRGIWRASITFLECMPPGERREAISKITPGIALLSRVGQQANFIEERGYGGYTREQLIGHNLDTLERMAQKQKDRREIKPFTVDDFRKNYPIRMSRSNIYNYVRHHEWQELERRYVEQCRKLRNEE